MKKIKKILIPLLMVVCIPLFLAGCSSSNGVYKASNTKTGQVWYVINSKNNVEEFLFIKGNKVVSSVGLSDPLSNFNGLSNKQALSMAKQLSLKHDEKFIPNDANSMLSVFINDIPFKYNVASNSKSETIYSPTYFKYKLTNPNTTVTVNGTKYVGYDCYDEKGGFNYKLVTNTNQKLDFDKKNN
ncbi:hypothetical protein [Ligilactobacillus araffinosus]|uniref:Lipoprotein n=1 Tax=Ligilactobacillus araffinosus DSM 20653 TaxID=1423820 RepID=A0A0R1ZBF0_9LACO|nr:hypothetical protein [Ligilactobacillus araffinosus]KRM52125.1 hypothetical protein FC64_GL000832 [Ligilactobacillus araffinosus DSM 20653]